jgi:hypothetical protein
MAVTTRRAAKPRAIAHRGARVLCTRTRSGSSLAETLGWTASGLTPAGRPRAERTVGAAAFAQPKTPRVAHALRPTATIAAIPRAFDRRTAGA